VFSTRQKPAPRTVTGAVRGCSALPLTIVVPPAPGAGPERLSIVAERRANTPLIQAEPGHKPS
jgi:hypothetical protein